MTRSILTVDRFAPEAAPLRAHFDQRFADPRSTRADRFVWDFWHVPGQYTALRTPAWLFFPRKTYEALHQRLVWWGRRTLGCHDVSPPWLSLYVDGCRQELHADVPHGQWAFVFSLTRWERRRFTGGQTLVLRDEVLDYWRRFEAGGGVEEAQLLREVPPRFNRLLVFDPRLPHGVRRVEGTRDPREGRLVIHGWFVQPRPFIEGPLRPAELQDRIDALSERIGELLQDLAVTGMLSFRIGVDAAGAVGTVKVLCDTTRSPSGEERRAQALRRAVAGEIKRWRFRRAGRPSQITLPLVFERG